MRLRAFLAALLWCAPATAQVQSAGSIINLVSTAPQAQTPLSASDLYLVIEAGIVKKVLGTQLALSVLGNLGTAGLASLPLSAFDSFLVVQGGIARRVMETSTLNMGGISLGASGLTLSAGTSIGLSGVGGISVTGTGAVSVGSGGLTVTSSALTIDRLGNVKGLTYALSPTLKPAVPAGGNFVFYVDAFDKSLYVRGWLGTVTKIATP